MSADVQAAAIERIAEGISTHHWVDSQDVTCACGWRCYAGQVRYEAWRDHAASQLWELLSLEQVGEWSPDYCIVNLGEPWSWDYNDEFRDGDPVEPVFRLALPQEDA